MTSEWRSLSAYTSAIDPLVIDVVDPFLASPGDGIECGFWERHHAGGPHVRIRLRGAAGRLDASVVPALRARLEEALALHPAPPRLDYSAARARRLLEMEGVDPGAEDLTYRHGVVVEGTYPDAGKTYASPGARRLAEDFKQARGPLAAGILRAAEPRDEQMVRLYFGLALFVGSGRYPAGSVSFKSHWEHFAASLPAEAIDRFARGYEHHRLHLFTLMDETERAWGSPAREAEAPLLDRWWRLLTAMDEQAAAMLRGGQALRPLSLRQDSSTGAASGVNLRAAYRRSEFVDTLWAHDGIEMALHHDLAFQRRRALVNLLYELVAALGFAPLDKHTFCHHVFHAVEERERCDLTALMRRNIARVLQRSRDIAPRDA